MTTGVDTMMGDIEREVRLTRHLTGRGHFDPRVLAALREVPREQFVDEAMRAYAFDNGPLPIGHGQTISQPYIVALMTDLLDPEPGDVMLEIGTGSGYQSAVLARLVRQVYSVEVVEPLSRAAAARLAALGFHNVALRVADGYYGWPEHAPYDGIVVTAAAPAIPAPLVEQLKPGARMVIPVGGPYLHQSLMVVEKDSQGVVVTRDVLPVAFVPLTGAH